MLDLREANSGSIPAPHMLSRALSVVIPEHFQVWSKYTYRPVLSPSTTQTERHTHLPFVTTDFFRADCSLPAFGLFEISVREKDEVPAWMTFESTWTLQKSCLDSLNE